MNVIQLMLQQPLTYVALLLLGVAAVAFVVRRQFSQNLLIGNSILISPPLALVILIITYVNLPSGDTKTKLLQGNFTVQSYESEGTPFKNYMSYPITVEFIAEGEWSLDGKRSSVTGPEGIVNVRPDERYRLPDAGKGALIMHYDESGAYDKAGARREVTLEQNEQVRFLINDYNTDRAYSDNYGELKVSWVCKDCYQFNR